MTEFGPKISTLAEEDKTSAEFLATQITEGALSIDDLDAAEVLILSEHRPEVLKNEYHGRLGDQE